MAANIIQPLTRADIQKLLNKSSPATARVKLGDLILALQDRVAVLEAKTAGLP
jgi:hypothetical protein